MENAIIGFRIEDNLKLVSIHNNVIDTSPKSLGNLFALQMRKSVFALRDEKTSIEFFNHITTVKDGVDPLNYYKRRIEENKEKINQGDLSFIQAVTSRGRYRRIISNVVLPDHTAYFEPEITKDYKWAYIYNAETMAIEFYGYDFDFKGKINSPISIPYYASMGVNTIHFITGLQKNFNVLEFLKRNHEQEIILSTSLNAEKPHEHKEGRKKKTTRRAFI